MTQIRAKSTTNLVRNCSTKGDDAMPQKPEDRRKSIGYANQQLLDEAVMKLNDALVHLEKINTSSDVQVRYQSNFKAAITISKAIQDLHQIR